MLLIDIIHKLIKLREVDKKIEIVDPVWCLCNFITACTFETRIVSFYSNCKGKIGKRVMKLFVICLNTNQIMVKLKPELLILIMHCLLLLFEVHIELINHFIQKLNGEQLVAEWLDNDNEKVAASANKLQVVIEKFEEDFVLS